MRAILLWSLLASLTFAQTMSTRESRAEFHAGTQQVLLDFVARDKHRRPVKNLRLDEISVYEDGVRQMPKSFAYRNSTETVSPEISTGSQSLPSHLPSVGVDPLRQINVVSIVFESMGPESRRRGTEMMHDFLRTELGTNTWTGVFTLNYRLSVVQPYTTDLNLLNRAVDKASAGNYQEFAKENADLIKRLNSLWSMQHGDEGRTFQPLQPGSAEEHGPAGGLGDLRGILIKMEQLTLKVLFQQEGSRSIDALRTLIRAQSELPGRKTVIFVSEGLVVPPEQPELLRSTISEANRNNVTFYTLDTRGLSTMSSRRLADLNLHALQDQYNSPGPPVQQTNLQENARELAEGTGGFAMDNSNDLRGPLRRIAENIQAHYELTYSPTSKRYDGHFRKIEVKVMRPGVTVESRKGYYALPLLNGETIAPFEMAALNALAVQPAPRSFEFHAAALRFGEEAGRVRYRIVFSIPTRALQVVRDEAKRRFRLRASVLGLIKDDHGEIVGRVSKDVPFEGSLNKLADFQNGDVTIDLPAMLAPGRYHLEAVALDREAQNASVRRYSVVVPSQPEAGSFGISDFVWVRKLTPKDPGADLADPLNSPDGKIVPELNPVFSKADTARFYFVFYPPPAMTVKPVVKMEWRKDGKRIGELALVAPASQQDGSLPFAGRIPLSSFASGDYEITIVANMANNTVTEQSYITVN